ncbi:MAG: (p)ppGpp synthetase, partial [Pseudomonadota bacterium]
MNTNFIRAQKLFPGLSDNDLAQVAEAFDLIAEVSDPDLSSIRPKGEDVAAILMAVHIDLPSILAALLSDSRVEGRVNDATVQSRFGHGVAELVRDVIWLNKVSI